MPKFDKTFCSNCGREFGPGDHGFSHCHQHQKSPRPDLSTIAKRNAFYNSDGYRNMTTAEKCAVQGDGFINDYD